MPGSSRHPPWYLTNDRWERGTVDAGTRPAWRLMPIATVLDYSPQTEFICDYLAAFTGVGGW